MNGAARGRRADAPAGFPRRGLRDVLFRVKDQIAEDNLGHIAAGVAFYWLLALFPALVALVSIYGLISSPADAERQILRLAGVMPEEARALIADQLHAVTAASGQALGLGAALGFLFTLWSATKGVNALIVALNIAYDEEEKRGFFRLGLTAFALTLGLLAFAALMLAVVVALPAMVRWLGLGRWLEVAALIVRWPLLAAGVALTLAALYRFAPSRRAPRWPWVTWGAGGVTLVWIVASIGFSAYVANFGNYNEVYGSLGAVIILLLWLWISAYLVLIGAELDAELERQTARDTTVGPRRPPGRRGAQVADTVGSPR